MNVIFLTNNCCEVMCYAEKRGNQDTECYAWHDIELGGKGEYILS